MWVNPASPDTSAALPPDGGCPTGQRSALGRDGPAYRPGRVARSLAVGSTPVGAAGKAACAPGIALQVVLSPCLLERPLHDGAEATR